MQLHFKFGILGILICCGFLEAVQHSSEITRELFTNEPCGPDFFRCDNSRCTKIAYRCDRDYSDCQDGSDELSCHVAITELFRYEMIKQSRQKAAEWFVRQAQNYSVFVDWDYQIARTAISLYLTNETYFTPGNVTGKTLGHNLRLQMLDKLAQRNIEDIPTTELAVFLNAFLVSCINPRSFHGVDLVVELRVRANSPEYNNPYVMLALCNAGENMTVGDIQKLQNVLNGTLREPWTDMQAYSVMALSCAAAQPHTRINMTSIADQFRKLLPLQDANGTIDNIKTTGLILQAFIASGTIDTLHRQGRQPLFDAKKAFLHIIGTQKTDGSFDDVLNTYYVLPAFSYKSLRNISFSHCTHHNNENVNSLEPKISVKYSLWFGDDRYQERSIKLRVPTRTQVRTVMDLAANLEDGFRYNTTLRKGKLHIYTISGTEDDPENDKFWFFYQATGNTNDFVPMPVSQSPFEYIITENNHHLVLWFRKGPWAAEE